jgi:hypothetical protein
MITNFIKYNEKYNHTQQDIIDDMRYTQFRSYLGYGAVTKIR